MVKIRVLSTAGGDACVLPASPTAERQWHLHTALKKQKTRYVKKKSNLEIMP
jgi:hypothetical protein